MVEHSTGHYRGSNPPGLQPAAVDAFAFGGETRVTPTVVSEAVAEVMRASSPGGSVDMALASKIGGDIRPSLEKALTGRIGSGAELMGLTTFRNILNQHLGSPAAATVDADTRKQMQRTLETANRTGSEFAALLAQGGMRLAALAGASGDSLRDGVRSEGRARSSTDFAQTFNGGPYSGTTLSGEMRSWVDPAHGITAAHVAGVGNYLNTLGINAPQYTGYFVGSSEATRNAIRDYVNKGTKVTDEHVKNPNDVKAIMGAIKAGKMKPEDAPSSVQQIIKKMEREGVSANDPKAVDQYFKANPKALEDARKDADKRVEAKANLTPGNVDAALEARIKAKMEKSSGVVDSPSKGPSKPTPPAAKQSSAAAPAPK
jgi:hypothetical protein